jgi:hypothetical protein
MLALLQSLTLADIVGFIIKDAQIKTYKVWSYCGDKKKCTASCTSSFSFYYCFNLNLIPNEIRLNYKD